MTREFREKSPRWLRWLAKGIDRAVFGFFALLLLLAFYSLWAEKQVYTKAKPENYTIYKPKDEPLSFSALQEKNSEVTAWLQIYGTSIDYPLVQTDNNEKYLNTDVLGGYSVPGSLYIDYRNRSDFSDFTTVIYGHHMAEHAMFGDIGQFRDETYFQEHRFGDLFFDGKHYGLEIFAFIPTVASDVMLVSPQAVDAVKNRDWLSYLDQKALWRRNAAVGPNDRILVFYTCTFEAEEGRHLLVAKRLDRPVTNPFEEATSPPREAFPLPTNYGPMLFFVLACVETILLFLRFRWRREKSSIRQTERNRQEG